MRKYPDEPSTRIPIEGLDMIEVKNLTVSIEDKRRLSDNSCF